MRLFCTTRSAVCAPPIPPSARSRFLKGYRCIGPSLPWTCKPHTPALASSASAQISFRRFTKRDCRYSSIRSISRSRSPSRADAESMASSPTILTGSNRYGTVRPATLTAVFDRLLLRLVGWGVRRGCRLRGGRGCRCRLQGGFPALLRGLLQFLFALRLFGRGLLIRDVAE